MKNFSMKQVKRRGQELISYMSNHKGVTATIVAIILSLICSIALVYQINSNQGFEVLLYGKKIGNQKLLMVNTIFLSTVIISWMVFVVWYYISTIRYLPNKNEIVTRYLVITSISLIITWYFDRNLISMWFALYISYLIAVLIELSKEDKTQRKEFWKGCIKGFLYSIVASGLLLILLLITL